MKIKNIDLSNDQADSRGPCDPTQPESQKTNLERSSALGPAPCSAVFIYGQEPPCEWSYVRDLSLNSVAVPWLNLLFLAPELASSEGQLRWVARPTIKKQVYDTLLKCRFAQKLKILEEQLKHIYPRSFLFRLSPQRIEYRNVLNGWITIRDFVELVHQILCVDLKDWTVEGTCLAEGVRKLYSQTPKQIQHNNRREIDDVLEELSQRGLCLEDSLWAMDVSYLPNDRTERRSGTAQSRNEKNIMKPEDNKTETPTAVGSSDLFGDLDMHQWAYKNLIDGLNFKIAKNLQANETFEWMKQNIPKGKTAEFYKTYVNGLLSPQST